MYLYNINSSHRIIGNESKYWTSLGFFFTNVIDLIELIHDIDYILSIRHIG